MTSKTPFREKVAVEMKNHILVIPLILYRLHVIIAWELPIEKLAKHCRRRGAVNATDEWAREITEFTGSANGCCTNLGKGNADVFIWLKNSPHRGSKASEYGTLYHELFHAVDRITETHNLDGEQECRAYIFEHLITEANKFFWARKEPKTLKLKIHTKRRRKK